MHPTHPAPSSPQLTLSHFSYLADAQWGPRHSLQDAARADRGGHPAVRRRALVLLGSQLRGRLVGESPGIAHGVSFGWRGSLEVSVTDAHLHDLEVGCMGISSQCEKERA